LNVRINLKDLEDQTFQDEMNKAVNILLKKMEEECGTNG
jgi:formiminotetrahydrofolate cyclodeaminase